MARVKKVLRVCGAALVIALALMVSGCPKVTDSEPVKKGPKITAFKIIDPVDASGVIDQKALTITVTVPSGITDAELGAMKAAVTHNGTGITPDPAAAQDYTSLEKEFTVEGANGPSVYKVIIKRELVLTGFAITGPVAVEGIISETDKTITISYDASQITADQIGALTAQAVHNGQEISPDPATARSYAEPVEFTIKDGGVTKTYTVTVKTADLSGLMITAFKINNLGNGVGVINEAARTISVPKPANKMNYELAGLTAEVTHTGASITPDPAESQDYSSRSKQFVIKDAAGNLKAYTVKLVDAVPVALVINRNPAKMMYTAAGESINLDGIELNVKDDAGGVAPVADAEYTFSPDTIPAGTTGIGNNVPVTITHTESGLTIQFTVKANIIPPPDKKKFTVGTLDFYMNKVNAGSFQRQLGATATLADVTTITKAYRMAEFEVTNELFKEVVGKVQDGTGNWIDDTAFNKTGGTNNHPAGQVNFYMAITFCNKLSLRAGLTPVYTVNSVSNWGALTYTEIPKVAGTSPEPQGNSDWDAVTWDKDADGFRLPTEMEFIWAAIGADALAPGQQNNPGNLSDWWAGKELGLTPADCANYSGQGTRGAVGRLAPNVLGLYDLNGNVQEIMWDRSKSSSAGKNPWPAGQLTDWENNTDAATRERMTKGGSVSSALTNIKNLHFNDAIKPFQAQYDANGFRVAINEPAP